MEKIKNNSWHMITLPAADPYMNMAVDEALFESAVGDKPSIRFYRWDRKCCTIGYFQKTNELNLKGIFVRRITGGGMVEHGEDITYSIVCADPELYFGREVKNSYRIINGILLKTIKEFSVCASLQADDGISFGRSKDCFSERSPYDIVSNGIKIAGSAQRRKQNRFLQQGSIRAGDCAVDLFAGKFTKNFRDLFKINISKMELNGKTMKLAENLAETKYRTDKWNYLR